jgi:hypothetical protein
MWGLKLVDAAELRVVVAAVLAVAGNALLVTYCLLKLGAHFVTARARLHVQNLMRRRIWSRGARGKKWRGGAKMRKKLRVKVWQGHENR